MNRLAVVCLIACGILLPAAAEVPQIEKGRDYLVHVWQTDKGLPQNWVSSIAQTPDGYLWVGTRYGGLARFDGVRFASFNQQNTSELKDVQVEYLSVDETGRLWISMGNESVTSLQNGRFELFRQPRTEPRFRPVRALEVTSNTVLFAGEDPNLAVLNFSSSTNSLPFPASQTEPPGEVRGSSFKWDVLDPRPSIIADPATFSVDRDRLVWFITVAKQLVRFSDNRFEIVTNPPEGSVVALAMDPARQLWIATAHRLAMWDGKSFADRTPGSGAALDDVIQMAFAGDGGLWVLEKARLRKLLNGHWTAEIASQELLGSITSGVISLHGDSQGNAWLIANGRGLLHCKSDGTARLLTEKSGLPSRFITCWFQDAEGDIWIGMHGGGIARIRERLFHLYGQAEGLPDKVVSSVCVDAGGDLWAGTMSGELARWQNGEFVNVPLPAPQNDPNESITVCPNRDGGMWIASVNHDLLLYREGQFSRPPSPWPRLRILFGDSQNRLWVGGRVNLFCLTNGGFKAFDASDGFVNSQAIGALAEDSNGAIWIGTGPGDLWRYASEKFTRFAPPAEWPAVRFSAVLPDTNGVVWIGTLGGGLLRFGDGKFTRLLKTHGLPDDNVAQLLDSHDGYVWGGTYGGIFRARKGDLEAVVAGKESQLRCRVYGQFDGLPSLECSSGFQPSCWRSSDGRLWFATANGVASVDPSKTIANPIAPMVIIEDMLVDGVPMDVPPRIGAPLAASPRRVKVSPGRHRVQFRYTGLNFAAPDGVRFRVQLEGGDGQWQNTGGRRLVEYGPLSPGEYRFRVAACNNDGVWNEEGDMLAFVVMPFFWETWMFKAALGGATLAALGIIVALVQRQRYRRRLERVQRQREMEGERTRIARDLHDDLGTGLTQIGLLSALANRETTPSNEAKDLIHEVRGRAREMVVALDEIVWAVNPKNDSLAGLVSYLGHFAEEFYRPTEIRFRLDIPPQLPSVPLTAESRHHLFLAFKEAVNNAARHSAATQVRMRVEVFADEAVIHVEDNGRGFVTQAASPQGNGLANMKRRLEQIGGRTELRSSPGAGTTVSFHVPLKP